MVFSQIRSLFSTFVKRLSKAYIMRTHIAIQIMDVLQGFKQSKWTTKKLIASFLGLYYIDVIYNTSIELHFQKTSENEELLHRCPSLLVNYVIQFIQSNQSQYRPTLYLPTGFLQLLYQSLLDPQIVPFSKREKLYLEDGGLVALDWMHNNSKNIVIVCHGMTGGGDQNYVKQITHSLYKSGFTAVCFNQRGVSGLRLATSKYTNMTCPQDLKEVIKIIKKRYPDSNLYGVGISIGSNLVLRYAGQEGKNCQLKGIVSIANPYDLEKTSIKLMKFKSYLYRKALTKNLKWLLSQHLNEIDEVIKLHEIDIDKTMNAENVNEFHHHFTIRLLKYNDIETLYKEHSCATYMSNIEVPTLCINSKNDPISPYENAPIDLVKRKKNLIFAFTQRGGHVEWFEGMLIPQRWIKKPTTEYLQYLVNKAEVMKMNDSMIPTLL